MGGENTEDVAAGAVEDDAASAEEGAPVHVGEAEAAEPENEEA